MDMSSYGPFATVVAIAAALTATFSLLLLKSMGRIAKWSWLIDDTPSFLVTTGGRVIAVGLIGAIFIFIDRNNYKFFVALGVLFGVIAFALICWFDFLRRKHVCRIPIVQTDGTQARDAKGDLIFQSVVIGSVNSMNPKAKKAYRALTGVSVCGFMGGFGATKVNDPAAIWDQSILAGIANKMTIILMGIILSAVMALYLAAASVEINQRPALPSMEPPAVKTGG